MFFLLKTFYSGKCLVNVPVSDVNFNFRIFFMKFEHHLFVVNWESCDTVFENFLSFDFWIKIIITFGNIDGFQRFYYGLMFVSLFINRTDGSLIWVDKIGTGRWWWEWDWGFQKPGLILLNFFCWNTSNITLCQSQNTPSKPFISGNTGDS